MKTLVLALLVVAVAAQGAPILIDNFVDGQFVAVGPTPPAPAGVLTGTAGVATGSNTIGGARGVVISRTGGTSFDFVNISAGIYEHSSAGSDTGFSRIIWDGDTDGVVNQNGFSVDLTGGGTNSFVVLPMRSDAVAPVTITLYSGLGNFSTITLNAPGTGTGVPFSEFYIPFSAFGLGGGTGVNFTNVTAITLFLDGQSAPGVDFQLGAPFMASPAPEPATFGLAGAFLGAAFLLRRRFAKR